MLYLKAKPFFKNSLGLPEVWKKIEFKKEERVICVEWQISTRLDDRCEVSLWWMGSPSVETSSQRFRGLLQPVITALNDRDCYMSHTVSPVEAAASSSMRTDAYTEGTNTLHISNSTESFHRNYSWFLSNILSQMNLQNRKRLPDLENAFMVAGGRIGRRDREFGVDRYTLLYLKWITKKGLLNSLRCRELCSMVCGSLDGRGDWEKIDRYIYGLPWWLRW